MNYLGHLGLSRNATFAMSQSLFSLITVMASYRILIAYHGQKQLGLWAFVSGIVAVSRILDVSGGSALPRFVSLAQKDNDKRLVADFIDTTTISLLLFYAVIAVCAWFPLRWAVEASVEPEFTGLGLALVPFVLFNMLAMVVSTSIAGALDGLMRADLRAMAMISGYFVQIGASFLLIPEHGVIGFAVAQITQYVWLYTLCRFLLKRRVSQLVWLPFRWTKDCFRKSLVYAMQVQVANLASCFIEPAIRFFMNAYGGLAFIALYDVANKVIVQARTLVASAISPSIPEFAVAETSNFEDRKAIIDRANRVAVTLASVLLIGVSAATPLAGHFLLDSYKTDFLLVCVILITGQFFTLMTLVQYFHAQAVGKMHWNILGLGITAVLTVALSVALGSQFGGTGVTVAATIAAIGGSFVSFYKNARLIATKSISHAVPSRKFMSLFLVSYLAGIMLLFASDRLANWLFIIS